MSIVSRVKHNARIGTLLLISTFTVSVAAESVTLNLKGADISALIGTVSEITGKNFIVDPRVKGKITIISSRPLDKKEVYDVFLSVLEVHGFSAIPYGKVTKIIPDADAKHHAAPTASDKNPGVGDEMVTRVIEVKNVAAAQLVPILRPLVPPQGHMAAYPQSNMLIISDRAVNIERMIELIARIDQPTSGEVEFVKLNYAAAADVVRVLNTLQQQSKKGDPQSQQAALVADERSNSLLIGGDRGDRLQLRAIIAHLDTPTQSVGDTHVIYLRYAKAKDLVPVLTGVQTTQAKAAKAGGAPIGGAPPGVPVPMGASGAGSDIFNIQADESSNALVITAPAAVFRSLESVIRQLDVRRAQVLVEAIIAEVSNNMNNLLGVDWAVLDRGSGNRPAAISNFNNGLTGAIAAGVSGSATGISPQAGITFGVGRIVKDGMSFASVLHALKSDGATNVLSTPNIVTLDNEEASIFVGDQVSVPTGSFTSTGTGGSATATSPFTTFTPTKVGIDLKVKPQISEGDSIKLDFEQKVENFDASAPGDPGSANIKTNLRTMKTTVMVDSGQVLVLGGLIKDDVKEANSRVPLLGDIPFLGALFRSKTTSKTKTNLMIFLRPTVIRDVETGIRVTNGKYNYMRDKQAEIRENGVGMISDKEIPVLPDLKDFVGVSRKEEKKERSEPAAVAPSVPAVMPPAAVPVVQPTPLPEATPAMPPATSPVTPPAAAPDLQQ
ncbi:MAG: type II secretion system secretin GspD [Gammaproteobacteria bacterium]|nr:type II secretion system secretin GspD [Gammaproteobacteria bacterium]